MTDFSKNTLKEFDLQRFKDKYTVDDKILINPKKQSHFLGVDEFKPHNGYKLRLPHHRHVERSIFSDTRMERPSMTS